VTTETSLTRQEKAQAKRERRAERDRSLGRATSYAIANLAGPRPPRKARGWIHASKPAPSARGLLAMLALALGARR
jgi:hypothetical protein